MLPLLIGNVHVFPMLGVLRSGGINVECNSFGVDLCSIEYIACVHEESVAPPAKSIFDEGVRILCSMQ
jgi:hypothetical protein